MLAVVESAFVVRAPCSPDSASDLLYRSSFCYLLFRGFSGADLCVAAERHSVAARAACVAAALAAAGLEGAFLPNWCMRMSVRLLSLMLGMLKCAACAIVLSFAPDSFGLRLSRLFSASHVVGCR